MCDKASAERQAQAAYGRASSLLGEATMPEDSFNLSIRKVKNGYVLNTSGIKDGRYFDDQYIAERGSVSTIIDVILSNA